MAKAFYRPEGVDSMVDIIDNYGARTHMRCALCKQKGRYYLMHLVLVSDEIDPVMGPDHYLVCPFCDVEPSER